MDKNKIAEEMTQCLNKHDLAFTEKMVTEYVAIWEAAKRPLIDILRNHPNWNEEQMAVSFDYDTARTTDVDKYEESIYNIRCIWQDSFYDGKPVTIRSWDDMKSEFSEYAGVIICGNYSFSEHMKHCCKNTYHSSGVNYDNGGITLAEFTIPELRYYWSLAMTDKWNEYLVFKYFEGFVPPTFIDEQMQITLKKYGINCAAGQKTSRVLNKFFISCGIDTADGYSKQYGNLSDAINPVNIRRHTLLSVHPCDYLHMSYGGDGCNSWRSCHNIDNGSYMCGTLSYMLDGTSMIFYTVSASYNRSVIWTQPKINRQVFCYGNNTLLQSRLYPDYNDTTNYTNFRNAVQQIFAVSLGTDNLWTLKTDCYDVISYTDTDPGSKHYADYDHSMYHATVSLLKGVNRNGQILIGAEPFCLVCGKVIEDTGNGLTCGRCDRDECSVCGSYHRTDDMILLDGNYCCTYCVHYCEDCDTYHLNTEENIHVTDERIA